MIERAEAGGLGMRESILKSLWELTGRRDMRNATPAKAVIRLHDDVLLMLIKIGFEVFRSVATVGEIAMIIEGVENSMFDDRNVGRAQDFERSKLIGRNQAGGLRIK